LIDDHPEIDQGLDVAREYGVADLDENGEWVVGDLRRLDSD
jgi:exoribonuclease II